MKSVIWISRHQMTDDQLCDLERIAGERVNILQCKDTLKDLRRLQPLLRHVDIVAAVLPLDLLAELRQMAGDTPVLVSVSRREPTGRMRSLPDGGEEPEFRFVHAGWEQVVELQLVTKML